MTTRRGKFVHGFKLGVSALVTLSLGAFLVSAALAEHLAAGDLDPSFGGDGKVLTAFRHGHAHPRPARVARAYSVLLDSRNRIVVVGAAARQFAVARYKPNGHLDRSFSHNGKVETDVSRARILRFSSARAGAIDTEGRIIAAGTATVGQGDDRLALVAYEPNGRLDRSFGDNGEVRTRFGSYGQGDAVTIDDRGRIVVAGRGGTGEFALARYEPNGRLDRRFGTNGKVLTSFSGGSGAHSVAIDSQDRIIAAGYTSDGRQADFALARYRPNGALDTSFGVGGRMTTDLGGLDEANSIAVDRADRVVAAGFTHKPRGSWRFALTRYATNGALDPSFGQGGKVITGPPDGRSVANSVVIDSGGHVIAAGGAGHSGNRRFAVVRYTAGGKLDPKFSGNGQATATFGTAGGQAANGASIDSHQRIVTAGYAGDRFALARFLDRAR